MAIHNHQVNDYQLDCQVSMSSLTSLTCRTCRRGIRSNSRFLRSENNNRVATGRRFNSSKPTEEGPPPTLQNISLASALAGFSFFVFTYSMNAVGRSDTDSTSESDPLAQLKEEAREARQQKDKDNARKLTPEEIAALESGISTEGREGQVELAVAAPADIAQMEEEANLKVFQQQQQNQTTNGGATKKKKPWWRFGF